MDSRFLLAAGLLCGAAVVTAGCAGLGQLFSGRAEEATCVINSKLAFAEFMRRTAGRLSFTLEVRQA
jgi:hypothetical protein